MTSARITAKLLFRMPGPSCKSFPVSLVSSSTKAKFAEELACEGFAPRLQSCLQSLCVYVCATALELCFFLTNPIVPQQQSLAMVFGPDWLRCDPVQLQHQVPDKVPEGSGADTS